jgi:hypothetical protein
MQHLSPVPRSLTLIRAAVTSLACTLASISAVAAPEEPTISIESLMKSGWQISGYASGYDNRTSLILFRHPTETYLVQCSTIYDVTRTPRTLSNCYELR